MIFRIWESSSAPPPSSAANSIFFESVSSSISKSLISEMTGGSFTLLIVIENEVFILSTPFVIVRVISAVPDASETAY